MASWVYPSPRYQPAATAWFHLSRTYPEALLLGEAGVEGGALPLPLLDGGLLSHRQLGHRQLAPLLEHARLLLVLPVGVRPQHPRLGQAKEATRVTRQGTQEITLPSPLLKEIITLRRLNPHCVIHGLIHL